MVISYPILTRPEGGATEESEQAWLERLLDAVDDAQGAYPVRMIGQHSVWHGGVHLSITPDTPVRAIADGTIVVYRQTTQTEQYGGKPYDTSFVLLRHETETGAATPVVFYSLYMNLVSREQIAGRVDTLPPLYRHRVGAAAQRPGDSAKAKVYRKDILGYPGHQHQTGRRGFHFEIFTTDADLRRFFKDSSKITDTGSPDFYGDAHFIVPAGRSILARHPRLPAMGKGPWNKVSAQGMPMFPPGTAGVNETPLYVTVRLDKDKRITTTRVRAADGRYQRMGKVEQRGYAYAMLQLAETLYADCPSAGYEWLRFGRILSQEQTHIEENWQLVPYAPGAVGYIDLAARGIIRLSDADFPHWLGWKAIDEGAMLNPAGAFVDDPATLRLVRNDSEASRSALRHLVVKHPSEWDTADLESRFARLRKPGQPLSRDDSWNQFKEQADKFAFWSQTGLPRSVWHFHPLQFIYQMRRALWLSTAELRQAVPARVLRGIGPGIPKRIVYEPTLADAGVLVRTHTNDLNAMWRKYGITTHARLAAFLGNALPETAWLRTTRELQANSCWYAPWYGRGFLQLTGPRNYIAYWRFRGRIVSATMELALQAAHEQAHRKRENSPLRALEDNLPAEVASWRGDVGFVRYDAADSAGYYWLKNGANEEADRFSPTTRRAVTLDPTSRLKKNAAFSLYENVSFRRVSCIVNLPQHVNHDNPSLNGLVDRYHAHAYAQVLLFDWPNFPDKEGKLQFQPEDFEWKQG